MTCHVCKEEPCIHGYCKCDFVVTSRVCHKCEEEKLMKEMERYQNMREREGILLLIHIHDKLWLDKHFSLKDRIDGCAIIQKLIVEFNFRRPQ